jgi:hypothetical protein
VNTKFIVPLLPSLALTLPMEMAGCESSLRTVPVPCGFEIVAFVGPARLTKNVSSGSNVVSPLTLTVTLRDVTPGGNESAVLPTAV